MAHRVQHLAGIQLILISAQFLAGMAVNLFVRIPAAHPGANASNYFAGALAGIAWGLLHASALLQLHVFLGAVIWLLAIWVVVRVWRLGARSVVWAAVLGWTGLTGAGFNGASFINYGHNLSSFLMAAAMLLAAVSYVWLRDAAGTLSAP